MSTARWASKGVGCNKRSALHQWAVERCNALRLLHPTVLRATAARVPIIACHVGGMPDELRDGENGLLTEPRDVEALAAAINRGLGDLVERARPDEAGRALTLCEFSVDSMCDGNLAVYRRLIGSCQ